MVYPWVDTCCLLGFKTMQRNCRGTSKCLQSCWGLEKLVLVSWKCHAVAWHHGLYEIWRQACQWFGFAFRLCSWSCMLAPRKSMQADLHAARFPYVLIICSLPVVFVCNALFLFLRLYFHMYKPQTNLVNVCAQLISLRNEHFFWWHLRCAVFSYVQTPGILWKHLCAAHSIGESHAMTTPLICCVFICTNPNQTSILGSGRNLQLPRAKKEINWTFLLNPVAPAGIVRPHRFEVWTRFAWGLYIWKTSMPELCHLKCSCHCKVSDGTCIPSLFEVCTYENTACESVLAASVLFLSLFRAGWCLLMLPEALAQTSMFEREWQIHVSHRQIAIQQLLRQ